MNNDNNFLARIIPATRILQALTNRGKIKREYIKNAQEIIDDAQKDYHECIDDFFNNHLQEMKRYIHIIEHQENSDEIINEISSSIANFRANISMINNGDYVDICSTVLRCMESIEIVDEDAVDILNGYYMSLEKIFMTRELSAQQINFIVLEMNQACKRYFTKHSDLKVTKNMNNTKALYVSDTHFGFDIDDSSLSSDKTSDDKNEEERD